MTALQDPVTDAGRLDRLRQTRLLDSAAEEGFDRLTRIATRALGVPMAVVSLIDRDRQFFKSQVGLCEPYATDRQTPLTHSLCQYVVRTGEPLVVTDTRSDQRVWDSLAVPDLGILAYAGVPLVTPDGAVLGSFGAASDRPREWSADDLALLADLAAAAMAQVEAARLHADAQAANRAKDRFLAILSHELRTPLSPALLLATAIADDPAVPESVRADAATIGRNVRQQTRLVDDLLDVTRIENGKLSLATAVFDLCGLLAEVVADGRGEADRKQLAMAVDLGRPCFVNGDAGRLRQVFGNLLRNAVKFTPAGGRIDLSAAPACGGGGDGGGTRVAVTVADSGIGVDPAVLPRLFDPFEQGSKAITDEFSGLGLGLAIAKGLVDAHGGQITAASDGPGRGTSFTVVLPTVAPPAGAVAVPPPVVLPVAKPAGVDILLVEDHKDTLAAMTRLLRRLGHRVTGADSVAAALAAADGGSFDLLVSDVDLPDGTGLDLMRRLAAVERDRPLRGIALTGYGMDSDVQRSEAAGFFAHLVKPINFADLEAAIGRASAAAAVP